jgi:hypothetical protein
VRFEAQHQFNGPPPAVAAMLADPTFYLGLAFPDLSLPELVDTHKDRDVVTLRLRYEFVGNLDPIARRLLGSGRLTWIQEVRVDQSTDSGSLRFEAERDPGRLHGRADFTLTTVPGGCVRRLEGDLVVAVPGIGRMAERRIVPGIVARLDIEAQALADRLQNRR